MPSDNFEAIIVSRSTSSSIASTIAMNGNATCACVSHRSPNRSQRSVTARRTAGGALSFRVIPLFCTIIGFLLTYIASCDGHRNPSSPGGRRPEASHSLYESIGWMTL